MNNKIVVAFSGEGTTLQALIDKCNVAKVVGTITNNAYAGGIARSNKSNIPCVIIPYSTETMIHSMEMLLNIFNDIEYLVLAGFMKILKPEFLIWCSIHNIQIINIHPSLLPAYKGLHTHQRVLDNKELYHGMTIHYVTPEVDSGEIIKQAGIPILFDDTAETLEHKIKQMEQYWYPIVVDKLIKGEI